jgi:hypothetical protein
VVSVWEPQTEARASLGSRSDLSGNRQFLVYGNQETQEVGRFQSEVPTVPMVPTEKHMGTTLIALLFQDGSTDPVQAELAVTADGDFVGEMGPSL